MLQEEMVLFTENSTSSDQKNRMLLNLLYPSYPVTGQERILTSSPGISPSQVID
nr:hypothetical protein Q903MT_gene737 [Picea sitchensis]